MLKKFEDRSVEASFYLADGQEYKEVSKLAGYHMKFIWNTGNETFNVLVDDRSIQLSSNQILCCTYLQKIIIPPTENINSLIYIGFNQAFYCIHTNDAEVSCNGLLFFGSDYTPVITLDEEEQQKLQTLINVLQDEFDTIDRNQEEMLRILLKRFIIRCTRLARKQLINKSLPENQIDVIRMFNVLVEEHFKTHRQVADYAGRMNRSPKTITNIFSLHSDKSPLQIIHERLILEAKRLLLYTDKSSKEIAAELGFDDPSQFSKFFKKYTNTPAQQFREENHL